MSQWVRLWEELPTDPKWRVIARKSGRSISEVIAVFNFMMICAANAPNAKANATERKCKRGELFNWNDDDVAIALDLETDDVLQIRNAMEGKVLQNSRLIAWEKRQPLREDRSAERSRAWRERNRTQPTENERTANAPDTDTDTDTTHFVRSPRARTRETTHKKNEKVIKKQLDEDTSLSGSQIEAANEKGLSEAERLAEWTKFRNYNLAKGSELADWDAAWRMWLEKTKTPPPGKPNGHAKPQVFVVEDTPQWNAWVDSYQKSCGKPPPKTTKPGTMKIGWYFPTEWPMVVSHNETSTSTS